MRSFLQIFAGLLGFLLLIFIVNFLGILPLSRSLPQFFGFLPQKSINVPSETSSSKISTSKKKIQFPCPIKKSPCPPADVITGSTTLPNFQGLGYKDQTNGTEVNSILSGKYSVIESTNSAEENINLNIINEQNNLQVNYRFRGKSNLEKEGSLSQGQVIGFFSGQGRGDKNFGAKYNLIIYVQDFKSGQSLKLDSFEDGLVINSP